ncbi:hypothetical protein [Pseudomonas sp. NPDC096950]|uniref:hypothetical protein n=1 Tax=Pseudomonas sp. NPDC096950 TaxID=3364485 RepID=UPI00383B984D
MWINKAEKQKTNDGKFYYSKTCYCACHIPYQARSVERSWVKKFDSARLPWGNTIEVIPARFLKKGTLNDLRDQQKSRKIREDQSKPETYVASPYKHLSFLDPLDAKQLLLTYRSTHFCFWLNMKLTGRLFSGVVAFFLAIALIFIHYDTQWTFNNLITDSAWFVCLFFGPPFTCWMLGSFVCKYFPKHCPDTTQEPEWELNRRTGLVTLYDYKNNGEYKKKRHSRQTYSPLLRVRRLSTHFQ